MKIVCGLVLLAVAATFCRAGVDSCRNVDGFSLPPQGSSYVSYSYTVTAGTRDCSSVALICNATVPVINLRNRIWYIEPTKSDNGLFYKPNWIQIYNVQCPPGAALHLFPLFLETMGGATPTSDCAGLDVVTVNIPGEDDPIELCGGDGARTASDLYNDGFGIIVEEGNATIEFCTNGDEVEQRGFAIRATCVDPSLSFQTGCVDLQEHKSFPSEKGKHFVNMILNEFEDPAGPNIVHKRSVSRKRLPLREARILKMLRSGKNKRFVNEIIEFDLADGHVVEYVSENQLIFDFDNGTLRTFEVPWIVATNDVLGTRIYDVRGPRGLRFCGPGKVQIVGGVAQFSYSICDLTDLILPDMETSSFINRITEYIYRNYVTPYPVICPANGDPLMFPLPDASMGDPRIRPVYTLGWVQEDIQNGICRRAVRLESAPASDSRIEQSLLNFCRFFYYSCNALLRTICQETVNVDRASG